MNFQRFSDNQRQEITEKLEKQIKDRLENLEKNVPSEDAVKACAKDWRELKEGEGKDRQYGLQEKALKLLFKPYPENTDEVSILLKVTALNKFYNTSIFAPYAMSKHIFDYGIDEKLEAIGKRIKDFKLINETTGKEMARFIDKIAQVKANGPQFYSFATKYCSFHKPDVFPIYDSYVDKVLWYLKEKNKQDKTGKFSDFGKNQLKDDYNVFIKTIGEFRDGYGLSDCSLRETDTYLWQMGREYLKDINFDCGGEKLSKEITKKRITNFILNKTNV